jgi:hypothetical protein
MQLNLLIEKMMIHEATYRRQIIFSNPPCDKCYKVNRRVKEKHSRSKMIFKNTFIKNEKL